MSRPIKAAPCEVQSTGVACPNIIAYRLVQYTHREYNHPARGIWVIASACPEGIIFKIQKGMHSARSEDTGHYTYNYSWGTHLVLRQELSTYLKKLFDQVIMHTRDWGKTAELSLKFLAKTLENQMLLVPDELLLYIDPKLYECVKWGNKTAAIYSMQEHYVALIVTGTSEFEVHLASSYDSKNIHMKLFDICQNPNPKVAQVLIKFLSKTLE